MCFFCALIHRQATPASPSLLGRCRCHLAVKRYMKHRRPAGRSVNVLRQVAGARSAEQPGVLTHIVFVSRATQSSPSLLGRCRCHLAVKRYMKHRRPAGRSVNVLRQVAGARSAEQPGVLTHIVFVSRATQSSPSLLGR